MDQLNMYLPPFAQDYSGVCSVMFELGGLVVIHGPNGCVGNYTSYDEPRWYGSSSQILGSVLKEMDAITGNDEKLIQQIIDQARKSKPAFICVVGTPIPMLIGTDMEGIAAEVENRTGIPTIGLATTGMQFYDAGADKAMLALAKKFCKPQQTLEGSVNLIGATAIDFHMGQDVKLIQRQLMLRGYQVNSTFAMGSSLADIEKAPCAQANIVIAQSGNGAAEFLKREYGIPYMTGIPVGKKGTESFFALLEQTIEDGTSHKMTCSAMGDAKVLLVGELVAANSLRYCLTHEYGVTGIDIYSIFTPCPALMEENDRHISGEHELQRVINSKPYNMIIADPLIETLIEHREDVVCLPWPSCAVSSKLHWDECISLIGENVHTLANIILSKGDIL